MQGLILTNSEWIVMGMYCIGMRILPLHLHGKLITGSLMHVCHNKTQIVNRTREERNLSCSGVYMLASCFQLCIHVSTYKWTNSANLAMLNSKEQNFAK
jgi:hypothetical protein